MLQSRLYVADTEALAAVAFFPDHVRAPRFVGGVSVY